MEKKPRYYTYFSIEFGKVNLCTYLKYFDIDEYYDGQWYVK